MSFADFYRDEDEEETFGSKRTGGGNPARGGRGGRRGAANKLTIKSGREIGGGDNDFGNYGSTAITKESDKIGEEIIQSLSKINDQNNKIEKIVDKLGTPKDTHELREQLSRELETTAKHAKQTGALMTSLQKIVQQDASDNSAKLLLNKLKKEVSDSISRFDKIAKLSAKKEKEFVVKQKKEQQQLQKKLGSNGGVYDSSADEYSEQDELLQAQQQLQAQKQREKELLMNQIEHNESLIAEREDDIKKIETEVVEISNIMRELNYLVNEQGEQIIVIDDLVSETAQHVKAGNKDLGQAENLDKKSRNLFCILLIIVLGIGIAAAIILVVILKLTLRF